MLRFHLGHDREGGTKAQAPGLTGMDAGQAKKMARKPVIPLARGVSRESAERIKAVAAEFGVSVKIKMKR